MPVPAGDWRARAIAVPGRSLNARSSDPFAPSPPPTTRMPTADTWGTAAAGGGAAGGRDRCAARSREPIESAMSRIDASELPTHHTRRPRKEIHMMSPPMRTDLLFWDWGGAALMLAQALLLSLPEEGPGEGGGEDAVDDRHRRRREAAPHAGDHHQAEREVIDEQREQAGHHRPGRIAYEQQRRAQHGHGGDGDAEA